MKFRNIINKISVKVALVVTLLIASLIVILNFIVIDRGLSAFHDVYSIVISSDSAFPNEDDPFIVPPQRQPFGYSVPVDVQKISPREHFKSLFQSSLLLIGAIALLGAFGIGFLTSRIVARPLNKLGAGMKKLRENHYQQRLEENDSEEFNKLIQEFNSLATELQRDEELRKNLISDTSHELKTPLAGLSAQLEGIQDGVLVLDADRVKLLREQVARLTELTEGLQDYASLRSSIIKPQKKNFHLKQVIGTIVREHKQSLDEHGMAVHTEIDESYVLTADQRLMERVFTNLFENAIRYSHGKNITVSADASRITLADDGVGIPPEHLKDIFERFFRLEKSRNRKTGGLGLGLAIVREIVEAHGWKIFAEVPATGRGISFVIALTPA
ncbi:MAG: ATP-binding protein [Patescibacteria group bacterium]|nr:ATP-binding protein [Patescibacteria group bacterium]MDD5715316.1 ATP-binding protein [Patescibacteria group bacterium]